MRSARNFWREQLRGMAADDFICKWLLIFCACYFGTMVAIAAAFGRFNVDNLVLGGAR